MFEISSVAPSLSIYTLLSAKGRSHLSLSLKMALERPALLVAVACFLVLATGRELSFEKAHELKVRLESGMHRRPFEPAHELKAQFDSGTIYGWAECWNALYELRACTNEIVLFFLNGESRLGLDCCRAIQVLTRNCWPTMFVSVGFTAQEGDILRGYCDASAAPPDQTDATSPSLGPVAHDIVV